MVSIQIDIRLNMQEFHSPQPTESSAWSVIFMTYL